MELHFKTENLLFDNFISFGIAAQMLWSSPDNG